MIVEAGFQAVEQVLVLALRLRFHPPTPESRSSLVSARHRSGWEALRQRIGGPTVDQPARCVAVALLDGYQQRQIGQQIARRR